jgi:hypothetical protein
MKKVIFLLILFLAAGCNEAVCPSYADSANKVRSSIFQSGSVRADGIHRFNTESPQKKRQSFARSGFTKKKLFK